MNTSARCRFRPENRTPRLVAKRSGASRRSCLPGKAGLVALFLLLGLVVGGSPAFAEGNQADGASETFQPYRRDFAGPPYIPTPLQKNAVTIYESVFGPMGQKSGARKVAPTNGGGGSTVTVGGHGGTHGGGGGGGGRNQTPQEKLKFALSGYEAFPSRADLDKIALAPMMEKMLIDLVTHGDEAVYRMRAVDALGYYNSPQVIDFLNQLAHGPTLAAPGGAGLTLPSGLAVSFQHRGIVALAKAARQEGVRYLEDLLASDDLQIQLTTVSAIGKNCGSAGRVVLEELMKHTPDPLVKEEASRYL